MAGRKQDSSVVSLSQYGGGREWMMWGEKSCLFLPKFSLRPLLCPATQVWDMGGNMDQKIQLVGKRQDGAVGIDCGGPSCKKGIHPREIHVSVPGSERFCVGTLRRLIFSIYFWNYFRALASNAVVECNQVECIGTEAYFPSTWAYQKIWKNLKSISLRALAHVSLLRQEIHE